MQSLKKKRLFFSWGNPSTTHLYFQMVTNDLEIKMIIYIHYIIFQKLIATKV